mgnify:CR=1 FL=1
MRSTSLAALLALASALSLTPRSSSMRSSFDSSARTSVGGIDGLLEIPGFVEPPAGEQRLAVG